MASFLNDRVVSYSPDGAFQVATACAGPGRAVIVPSIKVPGPTPPSFPPSLAFHSPPLSPSLPHLPSPSLSSHTSLPEPGVPPLLLRGGWMLLGPRTEAPVSLSGGRAPAAHRTESPSPSQRPSRPSSRVAWPLPPARPPRRRSSPLAGTSTARRRAPSPCCLMSCPLFRQARPVRPGHAPSCQ